MEVDGFDILCGVIEARTYNSSSSSSSSNMSISDISETEVILLSEIDLQKYCKNTIFIDMRGFRSNFGRFICKEFCLIDTDGGIYHKFVKSTFPVNKLKYTHQLKVDYQQKYGHRVPYDYGDISIIELITDIYPKICGNQKIFVRDKILRHHLQFIFRNYCQFSERIETLCQLDFDKTTISEKMDLLPYCDFHNQIFGWSYGPCAKNIALKLRHSFAESQKQKESR